VACSCERLLGNHGKKPSTAAVFPDAPAGERAAGGPAGQGGDNAILAQTLALQNEHKDARVILVSKESTCASRRVLVCTRRLLQRQDLEDATSSTAA